MAQEELKPCPFCGGEAMRCMNEPSCGAPISIGEAIRRAKVEVAKMPGALRNAKLRHIDEPENLS